MKPAPPRSAPEKAKRVKQKIEDDEPLLLSPNPYTEEADWDRRQPLRAAVLITFPEDFKSLLKGMARSAVSWFFEGDYELDPSFRGSMTKAHLLAAMEDLRFTAKFLAHVARIGVDDVGTPSETQLGLFADKLAVEVDQMANAIEERVTTRRARR